MSELTPKEMDADPDDVFFPLAFNFHMERMDGGHIWMSFEDDNGQCWAFNLYTPRNGKLLWRIEEDG